jgi:hypothetical protein
VVVLAALSGPNEEELSIKGGAAACVEKSDILFEKDSVALIQIVAQVVEKAKASSR